MCKAGFAGDDAPRAVFRKYLHLRLISQGCIKRDSRALSDSSQLPSSADRVTMGTMNLP
jgi:hypothetical protein